MRSMTPKGIYPDHARTHAFRRQRFRIQSLRWLGAVVFGVVAATSHASAQIFTGDYGVAANASVVLFYPSAVPGNQGQSGSSDNPAPVPFGHIITAGVDANQSGTDGNGVMGLSHASVHFTAQPGLLLGTAQASAESTAPPGNFPHGGAVAGSNGASQEDFWDTVTFFNSHLPLGASLTYRARLDLVSSISPGGQGGALAGANFGLRFDNFGIQIHAADYSPSIGFVSAHDAPVIFSVPNGAGAFISGYLQLHADAQANGGPPVQFVSSSNGVSVSPDPFFGAFYTFEAITPDSVVDSASGHDYLAVPEPGLAGTVVATAVLLGALGRRWATRPGG
ncbi:MAG TPA: hypothetical protein VMF06_25390 [Candidatus Limnocylindria bacterium]|nr:hypothetical protein [Candidatus Limnocylindria bacterium]